MQKSLSLCKGRNKSLKLKLPTNSHGLEELYPCDSNRSDYIRVMIKIFLQSGKMTMLLGNINTSSENSEIERDAAFCKWSKTVTT